MRAFIPKALGWQEDNVLPIVFLLHREAPSRYILHMEPALIHSFDDRLLILMLALAGALIVGGPRWLHSLLMLDIPAKLIKSIMMAVESKMNRANRGAKTQRSRGKKFTWLLLICALTLGSIISLLTVTGGKWMFIIEVILLALMLPIRAIVETSSDIETSIDEKVSSRTLAIINTMTSASTSSIDNHGIRRLAVEYMAEHFAKSIVSPLFWYALFGLPAAMMAVAAHSLNTLFPTHAKRHQAFGKSAEHWAAFFHFVPARLTVFLIGFSSLLAPKAHPINAMKTAVRDSNRCNESSRGLPVAAMAGALNVSLGGPRRYETGTVDNGWMGDGSARLNAAHVTTARILLIETSLIMIIIAIAIYWGLFLQS